MRCDGFNVFVTCFSNAFLSYTTPVFLSVFVHVSIKLTSNFTLLSATLTWLRTAPASAAGCPQLARLFSKDERMWSDFLLKMGYWKSPEWSLRVNPLKHTHACTCAHTHTHTHTHIHICMYRESERVKGALHSLSVSVTSELCWGQGSGTKKWCDWLIKWPCGQNARTQLSLSFSLSHTQQKFNISSQTDNKKTHSRTEIK